MAEPVRVVLLHGSQLSSAQWWRYAALLGPDVDLAVPDLPAHGGRRGEPFTWESALEVIGEAVEGGAPGVPVVLAGHSLGGYLALAWAADHPQRLAGLGLLGASAVPAGPGAALYRAIARVEHGSVWTGCLGRSTGSSTPCCPRSSPPSSRRPATGSTASRPRGPASWAGAVRTCCGR